MLGVLPSSRALPAELAEPPPLSWQSEFLNHQDHMLLMENMASVAGSG